MSKRVVEYYVGLDEIITYEELSEKLFGTPLLASRIIRSNKSKSRPKRYPMDMIDPGSIIRVRVN